MLQRASLQLALTHSWKPDQSLTTQNPKGDQVLCSWGLLLNGLGADWILVDFQGHREGHVSCQAAAATRGHLTGVMLKPCALPRVSTPAPVLSLRLESANAFHQYWLCLK